MIMWYFLLYAFAVKTMLSPLNNKVIKEVTLSL